MGVTAELEFPLSDDIDLVYIGSYREYESQESYDSDFSGLDVFDVAPGGGTTIGTSFACKGTLAACNG